MSEQHNDAWIDKKSPGRELGTTDGLQSEMQGNKDLWGLDGEGQRNNRQRGGGNIEASQITVQWETENQPSWSPALTLSLEFERLLSECRRCTTRKVFVCSNTYAILLPRNCMDLLGKAHDTKEDCSPLHTDFHSGLCVGPLVESFQLRAAARPMDCRSE